MKTIVALVDFSDVTDQVVEQARQMAEAFQAQIILLHAVPPEPVVLELGLASPTVLQAPGEKRIEADYDRLLDLRDSMVAAGVKVTAHQLEEVSAAKILDESRKLNADLLIVGSHHHSALYHLFVGTFTGDVLSRAHCPVLVVPAAAK